ncbi:ankyrin repeat-containing protein [Trichonephila clavata]|uniref:Ankyrin repeat-containing protein n=1 Tax=Trichonephila clavata TaxID=2740835 RepID=A0A8X6KQ39_TRICU|nr:ankyrin repeat-containing protein [Trichonephila clavata]
MNKEQALKILGITDSLSDHEITSKARKKLVDSKENSDVLKAQIEACKFLTSSKAEIFSDLVISAIDDDKLDFLKLLLETVKNDDEFKYLNTEGTGGSMPLNFALGYTSKRELRVQIIALLLEHGANPNTRGREGKSSLHCVINNSDDVFCHKVTELLLDKGADPNVKDSQGKTLLHCLLEDSIHDRVEIAKLLLKRGADPYIQNKCGESLLYKAYSGKRDDIVKLLLEHSDSSDIKSERVQSLLRKACSEGRDDIVKLLLEHGADPNMKDQEGKSLLRCVLKDQFLCDSKVRIVKLLLKHGADPNIKNEHGEFLLYKACSERRDSIVKLLLEHKANPNIKDQKGRTPLSFVFEDGYLRESGVGIVELLLEYGASPDVKDQKGRSLFYYIIDSYSDIDRYKVVELLLDKGVDPNIQDDRGRAPLHYLCKHDHHKGSVEIAKLLLRRGADPDLKDKDGKKPIDLVSSYSDVGKLFGTIDYNKATSLGAVALLTTAGSIALISGVADAYIGKVWCSTLAAVMATAALCCACYAVKTLFFSPGPLSEFTEAREEFLKSQKSPNPAGRA